MKRDGFVLIAVLSMAVLVVMLLVVASTFAVSARQSVAAEAQKIPAFYAANAGLERAVARMDAYLAASGTRYVNSRPDTVAHEVADVLRLSDLSSGPELPGGSFTVQGRADGGSVDLTAVGTAPSGATRRITLTYDVYYVLRTLSNAAVNTTGTLRTPDRVASGNPDGTLANTPFTVTCSGACPSSGSDPTTYTVRVGSGTLPDVGDVVTTPPGTGDVAFKVRRVDAVARTVDLAALDSSSAALSGGTTLTQTTRGAALLTTDPASVPSASADCQAYACGQLDVPPDTLFRETFGVDKSTFGSEIGAHHATDACSGGVRWIDLPDSAAPTVTLGACPTDRIVVVRAPPSADTPGGTPPEITVNVAPGSVFRGLLYVIGTHDLRAGRDPDRLPTGPGSNVTVSADSGAFVGSVIVENAVTDPLNAARTTTLAATPTAAPLPGGCPAPAGATPPAFCYDRSVLGGLLGSLNAALPDSARPRVAVARYSWAENAP